MMEENKVFKAEVPFPKMWKNLTSLLQLIVGRMPLHKFWFALESVTSEGKSSQCVYCANFVSMPDMTTLPTSKHVL